MWNQEDTPKTGYVANKKGYVCIFKLEFFFSGLQIVFPRMGQDINISQIQNRWRIKYLLYRMNLKQLITKITQ